MSKYISQYTAQTTLSASDAFLLQRSNTYYQVTLANLSTEVADNINVSDISDVDVTGINDGDTLIWDAGTTTWLVGAGGGASALDDLTDVTITTVASGNFLRYNGSAWVNIAGVNATYVGNGDVDNTELSYLNGVTSAIQTQLNNRPTGVSGTANYVAKYTAASTLANSQIQDDGTGVSIGSAPTTYRLNVAGTLNLEEGGILRIAGNKWLHYTHNTLASTASHNIGLGYLTLASITTGQANIAIGYQALNALSTGQYTVAVGANAGALYSSTIGRSTFIGYNAGRIVANAADNTCIGHEAGYSLTTGQQCTYVGAGSGSATAITGSQNTALGYSSGENINGASEANLCLGNYTGRSTNSTISNTVMIGYEAKTNTSNQCVIGARTTARAYTTFILGVNDLPTSGGAAATTITLRPGLTHYNSQTDETGHTLVIGGGQARGTGTASGSPADLILASTDVTTTGTTLNSLVNRVYVKGGTGYVGINKSAPITNLHIGGGFAIDAESTKTTTYAATVNDFYIPCDATSGAFDVDLPTIASSTGLVLCIKKIDASANAVSVDPNGTETTEGSSASITLADQGDTVMLYNNGTEWVYLSKIGI